MRKRCVWFLFALLIAWAGFSFADLLEFSVTNDTGGDIISIYASPASKEMWGDDILGRASLGQGMTAEVNFPHSAEWCIWDLQAEDRDQNISVWREINLCKDKKITLHGNGDRTWVSFQ